MVKLIRLIGVFFIIFVFSFMIISCSEDSRVTGSFSDYEDDGDIEMKVSIRALEQFEIIEAVLDAISQTAYFDSQVINQGPYAAMISFKNGDGNGKQLERWLVKSKMIVENGADVNKVDCWIEEPEQFVKAQFKITSGPTDTNPYGEWIIMAGFFDDQGTQIGFFAATAEVNADGNVEVLINQESTHEEQGEIINYVSRGKLIMNSDTGKGIVEFTDWDSCTEWPCTPSESQVSYAYNADEVIVQKGTDTAQLFNRDSFVDIYMDYNVYTAGGENIRKSMNFGTPLTYTDAITSDKYYVYYGGWQGRHQLWTPDELTIPLDSTLTSCEYGDEETTYTLAARYMGYLVEKTLVTAELSSIKGEIIESWMNDGFRMQYVTNQWERCDGPDGPWDCSSTTGEPYDISGLATDENARKWVNMWGENAGAMEWEGAELFLNGMLNGFNTNGGPYIPDDGDHVWVNINMPVFISYNGSSWIQYNGVTFNGYEPQINENDTSAYTFPDNGWFYMHSTGINYILQVADGTPSLKKELENVIQPGTEAAAFDNAVFTNNGEDYTFDWDSTNNTIRLLNSNDQPVTQSVWYMVKKVSPVADTSYTWQYAENENESWNIMTYLKDAGGEWVFLDDPIFFGSVAATNGLGQPVTVNNLAYDGHLFGIPDVWRMMEDSGWMLTDDMKEKIVNIPAGDVTSKDGLTSYKIKPRYGVRLLAEATAGVTSPVIDSTLTLTGLPTFVDPLIGDMPEIDTITVVEGEFVDAGTAR